MIRSLFLCLLLLLPVAAALTEDTEGSADEPDDEDALSQDIIKIESPRKSLGSSIDTVADRTTSEAEPSEQFTFIIIGVAVAVVALSVALIVAIVLVRRRMHSRQQGIYSVPAEQGLKVVV